MNDPTDWWSTSDDEILRGEMQKLLALPRPAYVAQHEYDPAAAGPFVERERERMVYQPIALPKRTRWARELGGWLVIVLAVALVWVVATWGYRDTPAAPCPGSGCEDFTVTPSTYGPPGPNGGPAPWTR